MTVAFIKDSMPAANAAHCVYAQNNALFFAYTAYIFHHQPAENENWATVPNLLNFANHIKGIDTQALAQCLVKSPYDQIIHSNLQQAMKIMNGTVATPTLYINGIIVRPLTKAHIRTIIDAVK
jgi:protein-disulfide isomerase